MPFSATDDDGLFATARRLGLSTEAVGYYLAYCDMLKGLVDACRSMSFYNVSTVLERFAPLDPVLTALVLWPRQFPFGLLKGPAYGVLQRELVERTMAFARRPLSAERAAFRLVHFSIPHLPFVFDGQGYNPPFDPMQTSPDACRTAPVCRSARRRAAQRHARRRHIDGTTIVLFADHGYRFGGRERDPMHVPFIVKMARQKQATQDATATRGEVLLKEIVHFVQGRLKPALRRDTPRPRPYTSLNGD